jgi:predicted acetyltransferase
VSIEIRRCGDLAELDRALMVIGQYFGVDPGGEMSERFARLLPPERMHAAWDGDEIVGGAGAFAFELSVPGGSARCAGTTVVGVAPTHRRRGILRAMMRAHLDDARERGDAVAALWASEETIYGRFGYGRAAFSGEVDVPKQHSAFRVPVATRGEVRLVDAATMLELAPPLWDALARERPGVFSRTAAWWEHRRLADPPERRRGGGPKRFVVLDLGDRPAGYAIYRHRMDWSGAGLPSGQIAVVEAVAPGVEATAALWRYLLDIDWVASVGAEMLPPDHPLAFLLAEPRTMRYRVSDGLWVRLIDVGAALAARTYGGEAELVLEVRDEFCPWNDGRWRLAGRECERTTAPADVALDVADLAAAYLGGIPFAALAQAGTIAERRPGALASADALFRHPLHPWCPEIF